MGYVIAEKSWGVSLAAVSLLIGTERHRSSTLAIDKACEWVSDTHVLSYSRILTKFFLSGIEQFLCDDGFVSSFINKILAYLGFGASLFDLSVLIVTANK